MVKECKYERYDWLTGPAIAFLACCWYHLIAGWLGIAVPDWSVLLVFFVYMKR